MQVRACQTVPRGCLPTPGLPSSDVDPGVRFETPEDEEQVRTPREEEVPARTQKGGKEWTETPEKEEEAELRDEDARTLSLYYWRKGLF
ncbi:hypothetical protein NDU88_004558 [Pleurodeles waltl]|uniref:Uncharacterized protein n=1 Tax=Pleurodeles waltl TaxID=8319 RepID=A0AAV7QFY7_PLEWA|nr:hypothetical protein NDU88_004558 [Pleurodeles waltl]